MKVPSCLSHGAAALLIGLIGALLYANSLRVPFLFDDRPNIQANESIRIHELSAEALYRAAFDHISKRPVANLSFAWNHYAGGDDVFGYHVVNVLVHCVNGVLVYALALFVLRRLSPRAARSRTGAAWMSLLAALIFVAHPIQTQSVTYIVQRMNSLATLFYLVALLLYIHGRLASGATRWRRFAGAGLAWLLALGSKQTVVVLPFAILLIEGFCFQDLRREWIRRWSWAVPVAAAGAVLIGFAFLGSLGLDGYAKRDFTLEERLLTQLRVVVSYIGLLLYPHPSRLNLTHDVAVSRSLVDPITTLLSLLLLLALAGFALLRARRERLLSFGILWFFLHLVVESSVLPLELVYEHRLYLPMVGFVLVTSDLLTRFLGARPLWAAAVAGALVLALGVGTAARNRTWGSAVTLWEDVVAKSPRDYRAHYQLGDAFVAAGRADEAIGCYEQSLALRPDFGAAHNALGIAWTARGDLDRAIFHYGEALRMGGFQDRGQGLTPGEAILHTSLGLAHDQRGHAELALAHLREAVRIDPDYAPAHHGLGHHYVQRGEPAKAVPHLVEAVRSDPGYAPALVQLAGVHAALGHSTRPRRATSSCCDTTLRTRRTPMRAWEPSLRAGAASSRPPDTSTKPCASSRTTPRRGGTRPSWRACGSVTLPHRRDRPAPESASRPACGYGSGSSSSLGRSGVRRRPRNLSSTPWSADESPSTKASRAPWASPPWNQMAW